MPWTAEEAREMGRKGGLTKAARRRARESDPEKASRDAITQASPELVDFLVAVATGSEEVDIKTRIEVAENLLAYGLGKPTVRKEVEKSDEPAGGLTIT